jgi:hypothetical protein
MTFTGLKFAEFMKYRGYGPGTKRAHYAAMFGAAPKSQISKHSLHLNVAEPMNDNEKLKTLCRN